MSFWDDINPIRIISNIVRDASGMANQIGSELSKGAENVRREFERGDVGAFIGKQAGSAYATIATAPTAAYYLARGDTESAEKALKKGAGGVINQSQGLYGYAAQTSKGQELLSDKNVDKYSLGLSGDYAGTVRGADELQYTGNISRENLDDTLRFGGKIATIGAGMAAYSAYQSAASVGGSAIPGYGASVATGAGYAKDASLVYGAGKALSRGDVAGAVNTINEIKGDYGLPQLPNFPELPNWDVPSWVPDLGEVFSDFISNGPGGSAPGTQVSNPWSYQGQVDTGGDSMSAPKAAGVSLLAIAAVVGAIYVAKKKGF